MILADIGNRHMHLWNEGKVEHIEVPEGIAKYGEQSLCYISVNSALRDAIAGCDQWRDLAPHVHLEGTYEGLGVDRQTLCLSRGDGLYVDAGSAITVDRVADGRYVGGFIIPGIYASREAFGSISHILRTPLEKEVAIDRLPRSTALGISYGIIAPIVAAVNAIRGENEPLYITGGDGRWLAEYFEDVIYDASMLFGGMKNVIEQEGIEC